MDIQKNATYEFLTDDHVDHLHQKYMAALEGKAKAAIASAKLEPEPDLLEFAIELHENMDRMRVFHEVSNREMKAVLNRFANDPDFDTGWYFETIADRIQKRETARTEYDAFISSKDMRWLAEAHRAREDTPETQALFDGRDRIYIKMPQEISDVQRQVEQRFANTPEGYVITDWAQGKATDRQGKQTFKIGKILAKTDDDLYQAFQHDPSRTAGKNMIVLSRNYEDIGRASTNRGWVSCAAPFEGERMLAFGKMAGHIRAGGMIAYLVSENDPNIYSPLARVMIKPFHRKRSLGELIKAFGDRLKDPLPARGQTAKRFNFVAKPLGKLFIVDKQYGLPNPQFVETVCEVIDRHINTNTPDGSYKLDKRLYRDQENRAKFHAQKVEVKRG